MQIVVDVVRDKSVDEPLTTDQINIICKVGHSRWHQIGVSLPGFTDDDVRDIESGLRQKGGVRDSDRLRHVLTEWRDKLGKQATFKKALEACRKAGIGGKMELAFSAPGTLSL